MPDLGVYWIAVIWCWIFIPHFIPALYDYTKEVFYVQLGGIVFLIVAGTTSMPEGHEHHVDVRSWLMLCVLGFFAYVINQLVYGKR